MNIYSPKVARQNRSIFLTFWHYMTIFLGFLWIHDPIWSFLPQKFQIACFVPPTGPHSSFRPPRFLLRYAYGLSRTINVRDVIVRGRGRAWPNSRIRLTLVTFISPLFHGSSMQNKSKVFARAHVRRPGMQRGAVAPLEFENDDVMCCF